MPIRRWTDDDLIAAAGGAKTIADICRAIGIVARGANYECIRRHLDRLELPRPSQYRQRTASTRLLRAVDDEDLARIVGSCRTYGDVLRTLGVRQGGGAYRLLR